MGSARPDRPESAGEDRAGRLRSGPRAQSPPGPGRPGGWWNGTWRRFGRRRTRRRAQVPEEGQPHGEAVLLEVVDVGRFEQLEEDLLAAFGQAIDVLLA